MVVTSRGPEGEDGGEDGGEERVVTDEGAGRSERMSAVS